MESKLDSSIFWRQWPHQQALSYLVMCAKLGYSVPGTNTIPEQIVANRVRYYEALDAAGAAWVEKRVDVSVMEQLLREMLANQLSSVIDAAGLGS